MVGYSGTPTAQKLGIKSGSLLLVVGADRDYSQIVVPMPEGVSYSSTLDKTVDIVHIFTVWRDELVETLERYRPLLRPDASIWVSWPKKASKVPTDITEDVIREGYVDIKVCAVDEVWSGLKLVIRKELR
jgi:hypothetical protein